MTKDQIKLLSWLVSMMLVQRQTLSLSLNVILVYSKLQCALMLCCIHDFEHPNTMLCAKFA